MKSQVEHLIAVRGRENELAELTKASFTFARHVAIPEVIANLSEQEVMNFHLVYGDLSIAKAFYDELCLTWPFTGETPSTDELNAYLKANPKVMRDAYKIMRVNSSVGVLSPRQWKQAHWGCTVDVPPTPWVLHDEPGCASVAFTSNCSMAAGISELFENLQSFEAAAIIVDTENATQWVLTRGKKSPEQQIKARKLKLEPGQSTWLQEPPEEFQLFQ